MMALFKSRCSSGRQHCLSSRVPARDHWLLRALVERNLSKHSQSLRPTPLPGVRHLDYGRRRGRGFRRGCVPPRLARRRAPSLSIKAFSASRTTFDVPRSPVKACALARRSSSSLIVVRMVTTAGRFVPKLPPIGASFKTSSIGKPQAQQGVRQRSAGAHRRGDEGCLGDLLFRCADLARLARVGVARARGRDRRGSGSRS